MRNRGFTLIELLVVIAIIAILAAILFPAFANAKERGRQAKCLNNLKQLTSAFKSYCDDYNGIMPSGCATQSNPHLEWTGSPWVGKNFKVENGQLWSYVRSRGVYLCPTDLGVKPIGIEGNPPTFGLSYSLQEEMGSIYGSTGSEAWKSNLKLDTESAGRSSRILLLIHEARNSTKIAGRGLNDGFFAWKTTIADLPGDIHYEGTTCSYVDGHVKWIGYEQLKVESDQAHANENNKYSEWLSNSRRAQNAHP